MEILILALALLVICFVVWYTYRKVMSLSSRMDELETKNALRLKESNRRILILENEQRFTGQSKPQKSYSHLEPGTVLLSTLDESETISDEVSDHIDYYDTATTEDTYTGGGGKFSGSGAGGSFDTDTDIEKTTSSSSSSSSYSSPSYSSSSSSDYSSSSSSSSSSDSSSSSSDSGSSD